MSTLGFVHLPEGGTGALVQRRVGSGEVGGPVWTLQLVGLRNFSNLLDFEIVPTCWTEVGGPFYTLTFNSEVGGPSWT